MMDASIKGCLANIDKSYKAFTHKGSRMTKEQVQAVLIYANQVGYKYTSELKDEEVDEIIDKVNKQRFNP